MRNRTACFSGFRGVNFFDGFKVEHRNLALSHSIETETVRQLHFAEAKILGFVMTNAALEGKKKYYKNYNYGYGYGEKNKTGNGKEK